MGWKDLGAGDEPEDDSGGDSSTSGTSDATLVVLVVLVAGIDKDNLF